MVSALADSASSDRGIERVPKFATLTFFGRGTLGSQFSGFLGWGIERVANFADSAFLAG